MATIGNYGGYGPPVNPSGTAIDYPPGPIAWNAGQTWPLRANKRVYAHDLNQQLSEPVAFLSHKPMFQGNQSLAGQSIPVSANTPITFDTEFSDSWGMHQVPADTSQIVIPYALDGIWLVQGMIPFAASASGNYIYQSNLMRTPAGQTTAQVFANGERLGAPSIHVSPEVADLVYCAAGDTLQLAAFHNYTAAVNTYINASPAGGVQFSDACYPEMSARWVASGSSIPSGVFTITGSITETGLDGFTYTIQTLNGTAQVGIPNPGTWTGLPEATSSQFNSDIRNNVLFLSNVPACRVSITGSAAAVPTSTSTQITGLASQIDNWNAFNFSTNTWTCPVSGMYLVGGTVSFGTAASAYSSYTTIQAVQSGTTNQYTGSNCYSYWAASMALRMLRFTAGDTVQLYGWQNSGSSLTPFGAGNTRLFTLWVSS